MNAVPVDSYWNVHYHSDRAASRALAAGNLRPVCPKRKRKLQKRGVRVFWSEYLNSWAWDRADELAACKGAQA